MPRDATQLDPSGVYANRFAGKREFRDAMWSVLCAGFFQKYIPESSHVLELAAGHCEFINHIRAAGKTAVDINPDTARHAAPDVKVVLSSTTDLSAIPDGSQDVVFASNFFEHRPKPDIVRTLRECHRILRCVWGGVQHVPPGKLLVLQPNIRYCGADYWMFFDHITPLEEHSLQEVLEQTGFRVRAMIPRFLPYTTVGKPPAPIWAVHWYLRLSFAWRFFGKQTFAVAEKVP